MTEETIGTAIVDSLRRDPDAWTEEYGAIRHPSGINLEAYASRGFAWTGERLRTNVTLLNHEKRAILRELRRWKERSVAIERAAALVTFKGPHNG